VERETELALVEGLRGGDARAFDAVYDAYGARLFTFLARLSRRRDLAEDLAEETWLRLVANAPKLRPDTRIAPWLFAVARNLYASACRSRLVEESYSASLIGLWPAGTALAVAIRRSVRG
jgi:RNA polymerase sigma-70 factor (ECF subfamily)